MSSTCPVCGGELSEGAAACPACGFKAQGATQSFQPITFFDEIEKASDAPEQHKPILRVVRGPQTGVVYELSKSAMTIGRNPQCDIFLNDMTVSRQHASLTEKSGIWIISDQNSFNGVWVKNNSISSYALEPGDVVQIGAFCLQFDTE